MFNTFYHGHLRKYVILFGTLFNDIYINREKNGEQYDTIRVPIAYSAKDKLLTRVDSDPLLNKPVSITLPRMGFEITSMNYSPTRKLGTVRKGQVKTYDGDPAQLKYVYNPVPYDINFSLYIAVKNTEDGTRIVEQILPFFTPDWTVTVKLIPELDIVHDIPTVLLNVTTEDSYEGSMQDNRSIIWTMDFVMHGYIYGPVKKANIINLANVNFMSTSNVENISSNVSVNITTTPGLLANGTGTTNATASLDRSEIPANSNFSYITTIT